MKKNVLKFLGKTLFTTSFLLLLMSATPSHAGIRHANTGGTVNNEMQINLIQSDPEKILLNVQLQNPAASSFTLTITDENDNELFSKDYNEKDFNITVKLLRSEDINSYKIGVRSKNKQLDQNYTITPTVKYISDIVVSKL